MNIKPASTKLLNATLGRVVDKAVSVYVRPIIRGK